jgi:hypothetical protein
MNANSSSLGTVVENAGVVTVVLVDVPSRDTTLSIARRRVGPVRLVSVAFELFHRFPKS